MKKLFAILLQMTTTLYFLILLYLYLKLMALAEDENQFSYNGFHGANLHLDGVAQVHPNGLLQLTNTSKHQAGHGFHAFYQIPIKFNTSSSSGYGSLSFSTNFIFVMVPEITNFSGHGIAFTISPSMDFTQAVVSQYLGLFNSSNNGLTSNHLLAIEFDTIKNLEFNDINDNHVGIDVNGLNSTVSAPVTYYSNSKGINKSLDLIIASNNYILGWSFNKSGQAQSLELAKLPSFPKQRNRKEKSNLEITVSLVTVSIVLIITILGIVYFVRRKKYEEIHEVWEKEYGPLRFSYKDLYRATKGFKDTELIGAGGFGKVYRGVLPSSKQLVAVKKVSHDSKQGMKEFVAEIASMGRLRHMNLVQLLGYCRPRGEMLLVYDYMPNGSLDKFLFSNKKRYLNWAQRYRILKGVASAIVYLHEEWEQVVLHRDVKASNVLLDDQLYGRLGDFGLARLYDHGAKPQTTHVVGTVGYLAPELTKTGKATTNTDVFAFGAFLLEVACGRRPIDLQGLPEEMILVDWVFEKWKQGVILETCDPILEGDYLAIEMELVLKLGLLCSHSNPATRPSMKQVMQYLDGDTFFPETILEGAGIDMLVKDNKTSTEFFKSVPSSSGNYSVYSVSSSDSILCGGR
ncbi:unnamed protein product [Camellia sinensis]